MKRGASVACGLSAALALFSHHAGAQSGRNWRAEERVLITSFARVGALARDQRFLYAATTGGLTIYDYVRERWELPSTLEDGYPGLEAPTALAVDPVLNEVWLGTAQGNLWRWRAVPPRWETVGIALGEPVVAIVPVNSRADDAIYVQTRTAWHRTRRLSFGTQPIPISQVPREAIQQAALSRASDPALAAFRARLGVDARARRWPITGMTTGDRTESYWFGTDGAFLFRFDAIRIEPAWLWYGAPSQGVTALAVDGPLIWLGSDGRGPRAGIARASRDLQEWTLFDPLDGAPNRRVTAIAASEDAVYFAAADGAYRFRREAARKWERIAIDDASSVAVSGSKVWVGTQRGLVQLHGDQMRDLLVGPRVYRVNVIQDSLWVATNRGVMVRSTAANDTVTAWREAVGLPAGQYVDVAQVGDRMYVLSQDALFAREGETWRGPVRPPAGSGLGRLHRLLAADSALWIAGERGVARYLPTREQWLSFTAPSDIPQGPVFDLAVDGAFLWLATPAGALRLEWRPR